MSAPDDVRLLAQQRADARAAKDFALADDLRDRIARARVGRRRRTRRVQPAARRGRRGPRRADEGVRRASLLDREPAFDVAIHWVCEGWLDDIDRAIGGFRANAGAAGCSSWSPTSPARRRSTGPTRRRRGGVARAGHRLGRGSQRRAAAVRSPRSCSPSTVRSSPPATCFSTDRDARWRIRAAASVGPFGIVTQRPPRVRGGARARAVRRRRGLPDGVPARRAHRRSGGSTRSSAGIAPPTSSGRSGSRTPVSAAAVVPVPVDEARAPRVGRRDRGGAGSRSKRNFYRFLDRWRDHWDLVLSGEPERSRPR